MSKEVQDMPETSDREKENLLRKRGLLAGAAILSMAVLLATGCKKKDIPESSTTLAESDVSTGELSGGDGSLETSEKQPMSLEEIAEKAHAVRWFDYFSLDQVIPWEVSEEIRIEEYPEVLFQWTNKAEDVGSVIYAVTDQETVELYRGSPIWSVYFCDLTGDGLPELCSTVSFGSGIVDYHIIVYDFVTKTSYTLKDRMTFDFILRADKGKMYVEKYEYPIQINNVPVETGMLVIKDGELVFHCA